MASDKGLQAELNEVAVACFCESSFASDMEELMDDVRFLMIAKVSQEILQEHLAQQDEWFAAVKEKHAERLEPLLGRLGNLDFSHRRQMAQVAWTHVEKTCPKKAKKGGGPGYLVEAWNRLRVPGDPLE